MRPESRPPTPPRSRAAASLPSAQAPPTEALRTSFRLRERYAQVWKHNRAALVTGGVRIDPYLRDETPDARRGLSLVARLSPEPLHNCRVMLDALTADEPGVYAYPDPSLHVTVQSLFRVQDNAGPLLAQTPRFLDVVRPVLARSAPFHIDMHGVTASRDAVLLQGFPMDAALDILRERLRTALHAAGLSDAVDARFRYAFAHASVARYRSALQDPARHVARLERYRVEEFGVTTVTAIEAVETDWYMTPGVARVRERFVLG